MTTMHIEMEEMSKADFWRGLLADSARLAHVCSCRECLDTLRDGAEYAEYLREGAPAVTQEERSGILARIRELSGIRLRWEKVLRMLRPQAEILAAADGQNADQQLSRSAMLAARLHFSARCAAGLLRHWTADIPIPEHPTEDTVLRVRVRDGMGRPVVKGGLYFCGMDLPVEEGVAWLSLKDFQEHLSTADIWLEFADGVRESGVPVLFPEPEDSAC